MEILILKGQITQQFCQHLLINVWNLYLLVYSQKEELFNVLVVNFHAITMNGEWGLHTQKLQECIIQVIIVTIFQVV